VLTLLIAPLHGVILSRLFDALNVPCAAPPVSPALTPRHPRDSIALVVIR